MLIIPLKVPSPVDLTVPICKWLESNQDFDIDESIDCDIDDGNESSDLVSKFSEEYREGILRLSSLRNCLSTCINHRSSHKQALKENVLKDCIEYHARLLECENHGFPVTDKDGKKYGFNLLWDNALDSITKPVPGCNVRFERACCLFNVMALTSYLASLQDLSSKVGLREAAKIYNNAAGICYYLRTEVLKSNLSPNVSLDINMSTIQFCETILLGQSQDCVYRMALYSSGSLSSALEKIACGTVELYTEALLLVMGDGGLQTKVAELGWDDILRMRQMLFRSRAQYHNSVQIRELRDSHSPDTPKNSFGIELSRLIEAESLIEQAIIYGHRLVSKLRNGTITGESVTIPVEAMERLKRQIMDRKRTAEVENNEKSNEYVPDPSNLPPIRPERISKCTNISKSLLPESLSKPTFTQLLSSQARRAVKRFDDLIQQELRKTKKLATAQSDQARRSLAAANLPQSVNNYKSKQNEQLFPLELWNKIEQVQKDDSIELTKINLWSLKELAKDARENLTSVSNQLDSDLKLHEQFRQIHESFSGRDVSSAQRPLRDNMNQCKGLLDNAVDGDTTLFSMLDELEQKSKYSFLTYSKEELDKFLQTRNASSLRSKYNTSKLSKQLVELTNLIKDTESLLKKFEVSISSYSFKSNFLSIDSSPAIAASYSPINEYADLIDNTLATFRPMQIQINANIDKQHNLLEEILEENTKFTAECVKDSQENSEQDLIESVKNALISLDTLKKQVIEGQTFYNSIVPFLKKLKEHSQELSSQLEIERCDFTENEKRNSQLEDDKKLARNLEFSFHIGDPDICNPSQYKENIANTAKILPPPLTSEAISDDEDDNEDDKVIKNFNNKIDGCSEDENSTSSPPPETTPMNTTGFVPPSFVPLPPTNHVSDPVVSEPVRNVDDAKMARLLELGFEADKIAHALKKFHNNENEALNELLSSG